MKKIIHITFNSEWEKAKIHGFYATPSLKKEGFIHCSLAPQIPLVANSNFKGQKNLILLEIDESKLLPKVKYEDLYGGGQKYPHVYGPINIDAVVKIIQFPSKSDGTFELPKDLNY